MKSKTISGESKNDLDQPQMLPDSRLVRSDELRLASKDWRVNNLYQIKNKYQEIVVFERNTAQKHLAELRDKWKRLIILKSRQLGITTDEAIDSLDDALWVPNSDNLMLSYDQASQLDIFDNKINLAWENLHPDLRTLWSLDADRASKLKFNWRNGSSSSIAVRTHGRSGTFSRVHISEFAKICAINPAAAREIISGTIQAVPLGGRVSIESTAEGSQGMFHDMFWEAWNRGEPTNPMEYKAVFYNWRFDVHEIERLTPILREDLPPKFILYAKEHSLSPKELTYYYLKWLSLNKDWDMLRQEYPTTPEEAFVSSAESVFSIEKINLLKSREPDIVGDWKYYASYKPGHRYGAGADTSEGIGQDNSTIAIIDFDAKDSAGHLKPELVAMFVSDRIAPDLFAFEIRNGCRAYGNCIVAPERNAHGYATIAALKGMYPNIWKEVKQDQSEDRVTEKLGWNTSHVTKPKMLFDLKTALDEEEISIPDADSLTELRTYPRNDMGKTRKDPDGKHWDRVIAIAIAWQMKNYAQSVDVYTTDSDEECDILNPVAQF